MNGGRIVNEEDRARAAQWLRGALAGLRAEAARKAAARTSPGPGGGEYVAIVTLINVSLVLLGRAEP